MTVYVIHGTSVHGCTQGRSNLSTTLLASTCPVPLLLVVMSEGARLATAFGAPHHHSRALLGTRSMSCHRPPEPIANARFSQRWPTCAVSATTGHSSVTSAAEVTSQALFLAKRYAQVMSNPMQLASRPCSHLECKPFLLEIGPNPVEAATIWPTPSRFRPTWSKSDQMCPNLGQIRPTSANLARSRSNLCRFRPMFRRTRPFSASH